MVGSIRDITARVVEEQELERSRAELAARTEGRADRQLDLGPGDRRTAWSEEMCRMLELARPERHPRGRHARRCMERTHPGRSRGPCRSGSTTPSLPAGPTRSSIASSAPTAPIRWVLAEAARSRARTGRPGRFIGTVQDITERDASRRGAPALALGARGGARGGAPADRRRTSTTTRSQSLHGGAPAGRAPPRARRRPGARGSHAVSIERALPRGDLATASPHVRAPPAGARPRRAWPRPPGTSPCRSSRTWRSVADDRLARTVRSGPRPGPWRTGSCRRRSRTSDAMRRRPRSRSSSRSTPRSCT